MTAAVATANAVTGNGLKRHYRCICSFDPVSMSHTTIAAIYDHSLIDHFSNSSLIVCNSDMMIESGCSCR